MLELPCLLMSELNSFSLLLLKPYPRTVWRCAAFFVVMPYFVKVILVQLPHKTGKVAVLEVFG